MGCVVTCLTPSTPIGLWFRLRYSRVELLQSAVTSSLAPRLLMWHLSNTNCVSVHFDWSLSIDANLYTFAMIKWEFEMFRYVRELLWLSPVMMLATLFEDKLFWRMSRYWSDLISAVHTVPHSLAHQSQCCIVQVASLHCYRVPWWPQHHHFLLDCVGAKAALTWTLSVLPGPADHMHSHLVCWDSGRATSCPVRYVGGMFTNDCMLSEVMSLILKSAYEMWPLHPVSPGVAHPWQNRSSFSSSIEEPQKNDFQGQLEWEMAWPVT